MNYELLVKRNDKSLIEILYQSKGLNSEQDISEFFTEDFDKIYEYKTLKDIEKSVNRIILAIEKKERIIIFWDYDIDWVTATTILVQTLEWFWANVSYRIPNREKDWYGLKKHFIDELKEKEVALIITVDNWISSIEEVKYANKKNIDIIITDHHIPKEELPNAFAIINPKQKKCNYEFKELCWAGIAFKLSIALQEKIDHKIDKEKYLDLLTIATIWDIVPLIWENRSIVIKWLKEIAKTKNEWLKALCEFSNIDLTKCDTETIWFQIGPRINVAGRIKDAYIALQLFLGKIENAEILENLNSYRKDLVKHVTQEKEKIEENSLIILSSKKWIAGIIGLIAWRLTEKHCLPTIIISEKEDKFVASCRSPEWFDIHNFLSNFTEYFEHFWWHSQAAGFSMKKDKFEEFKSRAEKLASTILKKSPLEKKLNIITEIYENELTLKMLNEINTLSPFWCGNEKPIFLLKNVKIQWSNIWQEWAHLSWIIKTKYWIIKLIQFFTEHLDTELNKKETHDVAVSLSKNIWNNTVSLQLQVIAITK